MQADDNDNDDNDDTTDYILMHSYICRDMWSRRRALFTIAAHHFVAERSGRPRRRTGDKRVML